MNRLWVRLSLLFALMVALLVLGNGLLFNLALRMDDSPFWTTI